METTVLITAFILIGLGVLVKRFPILIAGYNTMSKEEKMNVDVKGLSAFMCYSLFTIAVIAAFMAYGMNPATIKIKDDRLVFTGMYGITRTFGEIAGVRLVDSLPDITLRLNGLSIGGISKGWFKLKEGGNCLLLLSSRSKPYIVFTERTGKEIFFNSTNGEITETLYQELRKLIHQ